ncbi:caspase-like [Vespula squamosa]|uniref:Caspase-like n=1 Tax=Vespula squamosa TaxID=30214 RepID=A0ABD2BRQ3_VESSQ
MEVLPKIHIEQAYPMNGKKRGLALIFSHSKFQFEKPREGNDQDCKQIKSLLEKLGFEINIHTNYKRKKIFRTLARVSKMDHSDHDCLAIVVMTHGNSGILYAYDEGYKIHEFWSMFATKNCPSLKGKPKLFFIQACRGNDTDSGEVKMEDPCFQYQSGSNCSSTTDPVMFKETEENLEMFLTPNEPDFLIGYATVAGHCAYRINGKGSWYIKELCSVFENYGRNYDLLTLLTFVAQHVAVKYVSYSIWESKNNKTQIPCIIHTLVKQLYFFPEEAEVLVKSICRHK